MRTDLPHRWRGKFNEDTDLSLRLLKDGWCTILFSTLLAGKTPTLQDKGGNTDSIYNQTNKRLEFAKSLQEQHPDCVTITQRYGRWHHQVDYSKFKFNKLIFKKDFKKKIGSFNEYRFVLCKNKNYHSNRSE
jgi:hypothetical protein